MFIAEKANRGFTFARRNFAAFEEVCGAKICDGVHRSKESDKCIASKISGMNKLPLSVQIKFPILKKNFSAMSTTTLRLFCDENLSNGDQSDIDNNFVDFISLKENLSQFREIGRAHV